MRISFKNLCFLRLKPPFLADEIALFCIKKRRFFLEKAWNYTGFISCRFLKMWFYAMQTWQTIAFDFLVC